MDQQQRNAARTVIALSAVAIFVFGCMASQQPRQMSATQFQVINQTPTQIILVARFYKDQRLTFSAGPCQPAIIEVEQGRLLIQAPSQPSLMLDAKQKARATNVEPLSIDAVKTSIAQITFARDSAHRFANGNDWRTPPDDPACDVSEVSGLRAE